MSTERPAAPKLERVTATPNGRSESHAAPSESPATPPKRSWYRRPAVVTSIAVAALVILILGTRYVRYTRAHESTDDAFVDAHVVAISPKVASYVARVHIDDNVHVSKGDLLVELDPRDFEARLMQARANVAAAMAQHRGASRTSTS